MKKTAKAFVCSCLMLALLLPFNAFAKQEKKPQTKTINAPTLQSIEFNNARLDGEFLPTEFYYELIVENGAPTPTLKNYEVSKGAEIFVTYNKVDGENGQKTYICHTAVRGKNTECSKGNSRKKRNHAQRRIFYFHILPSLSNRDKSTFSPTA